MSELAQRSAVPVPTIKYYLREGLLPPGEATGATRARYGDGHVARLRLVRALVDVAGMSLERVREVLSVVDDESAEVEVAIGRAHGQLSPPPATEPTAASRERVAALVRRRRWRGEADGSHAIALAAALDAMEQAGQPLSGPALETYADAAAAVARSDIGALGRRDATDATTYAVLGTLLSEPVLLALRRMAQENLARRRLARRR